MKLKIGAVALATAFAGTLAPTAAPAATAHASCHYRAHFHAPNHHPKVGRNWWVRVRVRPRRLTTRMHYEFIFRGRRVAKRYVRHHRHFHFRGHMRDAVVWPRRAVGVPLTFRIVLHNRCGTKRWNWRVKVRR